MSEFKFTQDAYKNRYNSLIQQQTYLQSLDTNTLKNNFGISSDIEHDSVFSYAYSLLSNLNIIYDEDSGGSIKKFTDKLNIELSVRSKSLFEQNQGFVVHECPVSVDGMLKRSNITPDVMHQNMISVSYLEALESDDPQVVQLNTNGKTLIDDLYIKQNSVLSNIINSNLKNTIINSKTLYDFLQTFASTLENIKILKYTYNYKITNFVGKMSIYKTTHVYPDLPINTKLNPDLLSFYSAVLVSPFAQYYDVVQSTEDGALFSRKPYASQFLNCQFSSEQTINLADLSEEILIYTKNIDSDIPTFDLTTFDGSNGTYTHYRQITTNTYNLHDQVEDIVEQFDLTSQNVISYKNTLLALLYLVELWHSNIQVFQCDIFACHYNCHANNLQGESELEVAIYDRIYTVRCIIDKVPKKDGDGKIIYDPTTGEPLVDESHKFNTKIYPSLTFDSYQSIYEFTTLQNIYSEGYDPTEDAVDILVPWPHFTGTTDDTIMLTSYCIVSKLFPGEDPTAKTTVYVTDNGTDNLTTIAVNGTQRNELSVKCAYYLGEALADTHITEYSGLGYSDVPPRKLLKGIGNLEFHFGCSDVTKTPLTDGNGKVWFLTSNMLTGYNKKGKYYSFNITDYGYPEIPLSTGYIYYDLQTTIDMGSKVDMQSRKYNGTELKPYLKSYTPHPVVTYDFGTYGLSVVPYNELQYSYINETYTEDRGLQQVYITAKPESNYIGTLNANYTNKALPTRSFATDSGILMTLAGIEDPAEYTGEEIRPTVTVQERWTTGSLALIPNNSGMYTISYSENINPGTAKVTIRPTQHDDFQYGQSYYTDERVLTFTIKKPPDDDDTIIPTDLDPVSIGPYYVDWGEGGGWDGTVHKKSKDLTSVLGDESAYDASEGKYWATRWVEACPPSVNGLFEENQKYKIWVIYSVGREDSSTRVQGSVMILWNDTIIGTSMYANIIGGKRKGSAGGTICGTIDTTDNYSESAFELRIFNLSPNYDTRRVVYLDVYVQKIS